MKELESVNDKKTIEGFLMLRYCSCLLLHTSTIHPLIHKVNGNRYCKQLLSVIPDLLRAYQHTSRLLKQYNYLSEFEHCFQNALQILDQLEPLLCQIQKENGIPLRFISN